MSATFVSIHYRLIARQYRVEVRPVRDGEASGPALFVGTAKSATAALRLAANALAACDREGWKLLSIEPFPWGAEAVGAQGAAANEQRPGRLSRLG